MLSVMSDDGLNSLRDLFEDSSSEVSIQEVFNDSTSEVGSVTVADNDAVDAGSMVFSTPVKRRVRVIAPRPSKIAARFSGGSEVLEGLEEGSVQTLQLEILNFPLLLPGAMV